MPGPEMVGRREVGAFVVGGRVVGARVGDRQIVQPAAAIEQSLGHVNCDPIRPGVAAEALLPDQNVVVCAGGGGLDVKGTR